MSTLTREIEATVWTSSEASQNKYQSLAKLAQNAKNKATATAQIFMNTSYDLFGIIRSYTTEKTPIEAAIADKINKNQRSRHIL